MSPPRRSRQVASQPEALGEDVLDARYAELAGELNSEVANPARRAARAAGADEKNTGRVSRATELGAVADAQAGAGETSTESWTAETDLRNELSAADADFAAGNTISGEELRRRYGLP